MMIRTPVKSSNIASIGWNEFVLQVEFNNGSVYEYMDVPYQVFQDLLSADSVGKHFNMFVKGEFSFTTIPTSTATS